MDWIIFRYLIVVAVAFLIVTGVFIYKKAAKWEIGVFALCSLAALGIAGLQVGLRIVEKFL